MHTHCTVGCLVGALFINLIKANASLSGTLLCKAVQLLPTVLTTKFQLGLATQGDPQKGSFDGSYTVPVEVPREQVIF